MEAEVEQGGCVGDEEGALGCEVCAGARVRANMFGHYNIYMRHGTVDIDIRTPRLHDSLM